MRRDRRAERTVTGAARARRPRFAVAAHLALVLLAPALLAPAAVAGDPDGRAVPSSATARAPARGGEAARGIDPAQQSDGSPLAGASLPVRRPSPAPEPTAAPPPPEFLRYRAEAPRLLLDDKREGFYFAAVPAVGWDQEEGFNVGAIFELFQNGSRDDPFFRITPYRWKVDAGAIFSTEGVSQGFARLDLPFPGGRPYRFRIAAAFESNPIRNYFGVGEDGLQKLHFPGAPGQHFRTFDSYDSALRQLLPDGTTYTRYNKWRSRSWGAGLALERAMVGGLVRPLIGISFGYTGVGDYTGATVDARGPDGRDVNAIQRPTKLREDCDAGIVLGCKGGWDNFVKLGLTFDTRDFEPDPTSGVLAEATAELATRLLGSTFEYQRVTLSASGYQSLLPDTLRLPLVLAARGLYSMQFGDVPFFSLSTLAFNSRDRSGLGGFDSLRGFKRERFIGDSVVLADAELRWSLTEWSLWGQDLRPMLVPFVDAGRSFDGVGFTFARWRSDIGLGFRLAWNVATIVSFDYAYSSEDNIFYMELGHQF